MTLAESLALDLDGTREWTLRLLADLRDEDWHYQPGPGLAHALWICGHLACSQSVLVHVRCLGRAPLDGALAAHFPIGGPVKSAAEHGYPPVDVVLREMTAIHAATLAAVRGMSDAALAEAAWGKDGAVHPHYRDKRGAIAHCNRHEAFHAGQIATIRRLLGKAFLR